MKRILAFLLVVSMVFCLAACGAGNTEDAPDNSISQENTAAMVNLAYNSADSFNPYTAATTLNKNLSTLLFDPLIKVDSSLNTVNVLVATSEVSGTNLIVTLKAVGFTDGTQLTPDDVVYSFNLAKKNTSRYSALLSGIESAQVRDAGSVVFTLKKSDPNAQNLLTFPIIKIGSDQLKTEDNVFLPPVGTGRYILNEEKNGLISNKNWHGGNINIEKINLVNAPDNEALTHSVETGAIDYYYTDLSDCNIIRMSGERVNIPLNNLVYIGLNTTFGLFSSNYARQAVSAGINRNIICEEGYYNNAVAATGFFHPDWSVVSSSQTIQNNANTKIAIENLEEIGYNKKDKEGYFLNSSGKRLTISLIVNEENTFRVNAANLIAKQLAAVGIYVRVNSVSFSRYTELLKAGSFDMYIAETNIPYNMDITELVIPSGSLAYGINNVAAAAEGEEQSNFVWSTEKVIASYYSGVGNVPDIAVTAISEMPLVPVCFRNGVLFSSDKITVNEHATADDIFFGFENITLK